MLNHTPRRRDLAALVLGAAALLAILLIPNSGTSSGGRHDVTSAATGPFRCGPQTVSAREASGTASIRSPETVGSSYVDDTFAGTYFGQQILTWHDDQYVGYWNRDRRLTIAHRTLPSDSWALYTISGPNTTVGWDSHDNIALGVDLEGDLHVAANMHNSPMHYWRMTKPGDLESIVRVPFMYAALQELSVTYPSFVTLPDGELAFTYREGSSGRGNTRLLIWDDAARAWREPVHDLFSGRGRYSAYSNFFLESNGYEYVLYVWRASGDVATNTRLSLVRTRDFRHWQTASGRALKLPLTYTSAGVVVDDVPQHGGLFNNEPKVGLDAQGRPVVSYTKYDDEGTAQLYVARLDHDRWVHRQLTRWTGRWTVAGDNSIAVPVVYDAPVPVDASRLAVDFACDTTHDTIILKDSDLAVIGTQPASAGLPGGAFDAAPGSGLNLNTVSDRAPQRSKDYYVLTWFSLPQNGDRPRTAYPAAQPLRVYHLVRR